MQAEILTVWLILGVVIVLLALLTLAVIIILVPWLWPFNAGSAG